VRTLGTLLAGALVGVVSAAAAVLLHTSWWGLALGLAAAVSTLRWLPSAARAGFALGWAVAVARASITRPEGDHLVSADAAGWTLLACSLVLVVGALASVGRGTPS
jgi:hypothetical protein